MKLSPEKGFRGSSFPHGTLLVAVVIAKSHVPL
jgi:hypothetical protein